ncbi:hypothetical protein PTKIN_Ptkin01aG0144400 [Pterospermum kingtungense]
MSPSLHFHRPLTATIDSYHHKQAQLDTTTLKSFFPIPCSVSLPETVSMNHIHTLRPNQCCSVMVQVIEAPVKTVGSVVRHFDNLQAYEHFPTLTRLKGRDSRTHVGPNNFNDGKVGMLCEVHVVSGLPAASNMERLEILDDERHVFSFSMVRGKHRLNNYRSITTLQVLLMVKGQLWLNLSSLIYHPVTLERIRAFLLIPSYVATFNLWLTWRKIWKEEKNHYPLKIIFKKVLGGCIHLGFLVILDDFYRV